MAKNKRSMSILHYPKLDSILMVEKAIQKSKDYPTRMELWRSLPKQMQYQTFKLILDYLEKSNKIMFESNKIIWIFANNKKLNELESLKLFSRANDVKLSNLLKCSELAI